MRVYASAGLMRLRTPRIQHLPLMPFLIGDDLVSTLGILQNSIATISSNGVYELDEEALLSMNFYIGIMDGVQKRD